MMLGLGLGFAPRGAAGARFDAIHAALLPLASEATILVDLVTGLSAVTLVSGDASVVENRGLAGDFEQATAGSRPTWSADAFGAGRPGLLANGGDYMAAADYAVANYTARTMFVLLKGPTTPSANQRFFSHGNGTGNNYSTWIGAGTTGLPNGFISGNGTAVSTGFDFATFSGSAIDNTPHVVAMQWTANSRIRLWVDGTEDATPTRTGASQATVFDPAVGFGLLAEANGASPAQTGAAVGMALSIPRALTAGEFAAVQAAFLSAGGLA